MAFTADMTTYRSNAVTALNKAVTASNAGLSDRAVAHAQVAAGWSYLLEVQAKIDRQIVV